MKGKALKLIVLTACMFLIVLPGYSQNGKETKIKTKKDTICGEFLSAYRTFFKYDLYEDALSKWWQAFNDCPGYSEMMYVDGVTMYKSFIKNAPEGPVREGLIDTLMLIYDQRIENFRGEGNVLGRKGRALLTYRGGDIDQVGNAYTMLKKSVELEGEKAQESVMLLFISAGITLNKENKLELNQLFDDYFLLSGILDLANGKSSRIKRTRAKIDELMLSRNILTCEALDLYFEPKMEQYKEDADFLNTLTTVYSISVCEFSDIFIQAREIQYSLDPGPASAHELARAFIKRDNFEKASGYLNEALQGEDIDRATKAEWLYEMAKLSIALKDFCGAIEYSREAVKLNVDLGKAYLLLGDASIAVRNKLGDEFSQRTAFWAAADMYKKAASADPTLAVDAEEKLSAIRSQYPSKEEIFFRDLKEGQSYHVGGCINEQATIQSRK